MNHTPNNQPSIPDPARAPEPIHAPELDRSFDERLHPRRAALARERAAQQAGSPIDGTERFDAVMVPHAPLAAEGIGRAAGRHANHEQPLGLTVQRVVGALSLTAVAETTRQTWRSVVHALHDIGTRLAPPAARDRQVDEAPVVPGLVVETEPEPVPEVSQPTIETTIETRGAAVLALDDDSIKQVFAGIVASMEASDQASAASRQASRDAELGRTNPEHTILGETTDTGTFNTVDLRGIFGANHNLLRDEEQYSDPDEDPRPPAA